MRPFRISFVLAALFAVLAPAPAQGQLGFLPRLPLSLEVRAGAGIPTGDFADRRPGVEAETGLAFAAGAVLHLSSAVGIYGQYNRTAFGCDNCAGAGLDDELVDAGGGFGIHAALPLAAFRPWIRAGGVYHELRFSGSEGELFSDPALGFQVGGGVSLPLIGGLRVLPGVHFRSYSAELDLGGLPSETVDVNQVVADLGLSYRF
jgi:hypothetical protein